MILTINSNHCSRNSITLKVTCYTFAHFQVQLIPYKSRSFTVKQGLPHVVLLADCKGPCLFCFVWNGLRVSSFVVCNCERTRAPLPYELTLLLFTISFQLLSKPINQPCGLGSPHHLVAFSSIEASRTCSPNGDCVCLKHRLYTDRPSAIDSSRTRQPRAGTHFNRHT